MTWPILTPFALDVDAPCKFLGGTFKKFWHPIGDGLVSLSYYLRLHHWLIQMPGGRKLLLPQNSRTGQKRLEFFSRAIDVLTANQDLIGGVRWEARVRCPTTQDALDVVRQERPWEMDTWSPETEVSAIPVRRFIRLLPQLLDAAKQALRLEGFSFSHVGSHHTTIPQKRIFGDLKLLFGESTYKGYKSTPTLIFSWWREWRRGELQPQAQDDEAQDVPCEGGNAPPDVEEPPRAASPVVPGNRMELPDDQEYNDYIVELAREHRTRRTKRIWWVRVHPLFIQRYPGPWTRDNLKNRFNHLKKTGRIGDW